MLNPRWVSVTVDDTDKEDDMTGQPLVSLHQVALKWSQPKWLSVTKSQKTVLSVMRLPNSHKYPHVLQDGTNSSGHQFTGDRRSVATIRIVWTCSCHASGGDQLTMSTALKHVTALMLDETNWHCQYYLGMLLLWCWKGPIDIVSNTWVCYCCDVGRDQLTLSVLLGYVIAVILEGTNWHCQ
jgi:1,4-alpha-glucan branching enzyme